MNKNLALSWLQLNASCKFSLLETVSKSHYFAWDRSTLVSSSQLEFSDARIKLHPSHSKLVHRETIPFVVIIKLCIEHQRAVLVVPMVGYLWTEKLFDSERFYSSVVQVLLRLVRVS